MINYVFDRTVKKLQLVENTFSMNVEDKNKLLQGTPLRGGSHVMSLKNGKVQTPSPPKSKLRDQCALGHCFFSTF